MVALPSMLGGVDPRGRPIVRIAISGGDVEFLAVVDTGFNGELFMAAVDARRLGLPSTGVRSSVEVAGGVRQQVEEAIAVILWMGREQRVEVLLGIPTPAPRPADDPIALVGARLLSPHILMIDYAAGTVEIEAQT